MIEKKLFLIDGNSLLYRSFYAIKRLSTSKGFPTNAIYGFISVLKKLVDKEKPCYLGIVFDVKGPTIRHDTFKEYKANRKPMPEDLVIQIPMLKRIIKAMNIPYFEKKKYEADDLLGSLACRASEQNIPTVIVTTDKDLLQTVNELTTVYNPVKEAYLDENGVKDTFGVYPSQIVDVLALWGDPTDNVPGIPGIGEKTAKLLIQQFGSIENLLNNLYHVKNPRVKQNIENNIDNLKLSQKLVTIEKKLDLDFKLIDFALSEPNEEELIPLLRELEFSTFLSNFLKRPEKTQKKYETIYDESQLKKLITKIKEAKSVSLDTETDSPHPTQANLVGISFATEADKAFYLPLGHDYPDAPEQIPKERALRLLKEILADSDIKKIGQNIKYDYIVLKREEIKLKGIDRDTMILSYLLEPNWGKHNLNKLVLTYLQTKAIPYEEIAGKGKNEVTMNAVDINTVTPYACQDADLTLQLNSLLWPKILERKLDRLYHQIEQPLIEVLSDMETWGVKIDPLVLKSLSSEIQEELDRLRVKIRELSGESFNINSPQQLAHILFSKLKLPAYKKTKITKGYSTGFNVLQELSRNYPIAKYVLEYRQLGKLKSTYADSLPLLINPHTGRLHTSYNQTIASTGRLSSSDPNLQNIPVRGEWGTRFRQAFIPESGHLFLSADYFQIELRVLAHMSGDEVLISTFLNDRDVHQETAFRVFGDERLLSKEEQRRRAKIINFSIVYGTSAFSLAKELGTSSSEAQSFIDLYFKKYPKVKQFLDRSVDNACKSGFTETLFGRQRQVPELKHKNKTIQQAGRRIALNTPVQGTAADLIKKAMINIWNEIKKRNLKSKMILQVHDELVFEVPDEECSEMEDLVQKKMENVHPLKVPLKVHIGLGINWAEVK